MVKNLPANTGDPGSIPESGESPGGRNGNQLHYFSLEIPMDRGAWQTHSLRSKRVQSNLETEQQYEVEDVNF